MTIARVPIVTSVDPEQSVDATPCFDGSGTLNTLYDKYADGRTYGTQRPAFTVTDDASLLGADTRGRALYFWEAVDSLYILNFVNVWRGYGSLVGTIGLTGKDPAYFVETTTRLILLDPEDNNGWFINEATPSDILQITDDNFPPNQSPELQIAGGGAWLDGYLFVMSTDGRIWNSKLNDATNWLDALNFISAEREKDEGVYLTKHRDHIVAFGTSTIEFFYDAGNPVGSPLQRRQDIFYNVGCINRKSIFNTGEKVYFIGAEKSGTIGLYELANFQLIKRSNFSIDRELSSVVFNDSQEFLLAGGMVDNHYLCYITFIEDLGDGAWTPVCTFVFDTTSNQWSQYDTNILDIEEFSIVAVSDRISSSNRSPSMLFLNGDIVEFRGSEDPIDTSGVLGYWLDDDYMETPPGNDDYVQPNSSPDTSNIQMEIILGELDAGTQTNKFGSRLEIVGTGVSTATGVENIMVSWSDDHYMTFSTPRPLSTTMRERLTRLGTFKRRAHKITYTGQDTLRIEALELDMRMSKYA